MTQYRDDMTPAELEAFMTNLNELDAAYAEAEAQYQRSLPTRTVYLIYWDNGADACGTFPWEYATEAEAQRDADAITAENIAEGIWDEDEGCCEVISVERPYTPTDEEVDAAYEQSMDHLNRIAGDR